MKFIMEAQEILDKVKEAKPNQAVILDEAKPKRKRKETGRYIFPNFLAELMKKVTIRTQYEAGLMSMSFILFGLLFFSGYVIFFTDAGLAVKIMTALNGIAAFVFLTSYLTTTFQQYQNYLAVAGIIQQEDQDEAKLMEKLRG